MNAQPPLPAQGTCPSPAIMSNTSVRGRVNDAEGASYGLIETPDTAPTQATHG